MTTLNNPVCGRNFILPEKPQALNLWAHPSAGKLKIFFTGIDQQICRLGRQVFSTHHLIRERCKATQFTGGAKGITKP